MHRHPITDRIYAAGYAPWLARSGSPADMNHSVISTLEDELVKEINEETFRRYPVVVLDTKNSIAWHVWHITRIEGAGIL
ncbi:hypothetical protein PV403_11705 [Paenibacillus sp. GYB006]|uniref:hypothetical protein n=1 Tax=Paenibacillus sp. GYB006 TaxID=2994394 RepID=UPI002F964511